MGSFFGFTIFGFFFVVTLFTFIKTNKLRKETNKINEETVNILVDMFERYGEDNPQVLESIKTMLDTSPGMAVLISKARKICRKNHGF